MPPTLIAPAAEGDAVDGVDLAQDGNEAAAAARGRCRWSRLATEASLGLPGALEELSMKAGEVGVDRLRLPT